MFEEIIICLIKTKCHHIIWNSYYESYWFQVGSDQQMDILKPVKSLDMSIE